jgi:RNA polymerase sigma-70 factor (ECF subfamily)
MVSVGQPAAPKRKNVMTTDERTEEFIALLTRHEPRMRGLILSMVGQMSAAEEVLQETHLVLWRKFDAFEKGSNFWAWAAGVARLEVMNYRRKLARDRHVFSDEFVQTVAAEAERSSDELDHRRAALKQCISKLPETDRRLLQMRYQTDGSARAVASAYRRTVSAIYKTLTRIRQNLMDCIQRALTIEE